MTDTPQTPEGRINEHLAEENDRLRADLERMRALLERPITVNIQGPEQATLKKISEYLPQLTHLSTNVATIGGELIQARKHAESHGKAMLGASKELSEKLDRLAGVLEHLVELDLERSNHEEGA